jgi:membrane protease YdiL (CAAX protease family)/predicted permease
MVIMSKQKLSLFKLAKYTNLEIVMEAQVQATGANQSRLMERYKKNKNSIKNQARALKFAYGFLLSFLVVVPIFGVSQLIEALATGSVNLNASLFAGSIIFVIFFAMQFAYLLILGLLNVSALMTGEAFRWFETLPISKNKLNKLGFFTVFRNIDVGLILLALTLPIALIIITQNLLLFAISIFISLINVFFSFSVLIIVSQRLGKIFKVQEINSKRATLIRVFTMVSYFALVFSMSLFLNLAIAQIPSLFIDVSKIENLPNINLILSVIPFPFSPSYLLAMSVDPGRFSMMQWMLSIIGLVLYGGLTWFMYKKAVKSMRSVTMPTSLEIKSGRGKSEEKPDVVLEVRSPIIAYIRKDLSIATKDIQMLMFILMPIVLPTIMVVTMMATAGSVIVGADFLILWVIVSIYFPIIALMLIAGFLNVEDSGASILASLPLNPRDQMKAKMSIMLTITSISYALPVMIMLFNPALSAYTGLFLSWYPIVLLFLMIGFQMKLRLFGRMKYKYVLEEVNAEHKTWKWIFIGSVEFIVCFAFMIMGVMLYALYGTLIMTIGLLGTSLGSLAILYVTLNLMFPKKPGSKKMLGIRGTLREHPLLGTFILLVLYFSFFFITNFALLPLVPILPLLPYPLILTINFCFIFGFMALLWFFIVPKGLKLPNDDQKFTSFLKSIKFTTKNHLLKNIGIGLIFSAAFFLCLTVFGNILGNPIYDLGVLLGNPGTSQAYFSFGWFLFIYMLIPGIWEETSFRGVITSLNERKYSKRSVLIFVAFLFGAFHLTNLIGAQLSAQNSPTWLQWWWLPTILQTFYASMLGLVFGYMVLRTGSLIPGIIAHYLIDSVGQFFLINNFNSSIVSYIWFNLLGIGAAPAIIGFFLVWILTKSNSREELLK